MAEEDVEPQDWAGGISAKGRMRALMPTPEAQAPTLTEGQAIKMAVQCFPYDDPRLQALLLMSDEDAASEFARLERDADAGLAALDPAYHAMLRLR